MQITQWVAAQAAAHTTPLPLIPALCTGEVASSMSIGHHESCATCARAVAEAQAPALMDWRAQAAARVCKPVGTWQSSQRQGPRKAFTQTATGLRLLCLPRSTRGGARAVASPRSRRGHRNQMARSRHPRRSVRTRRRHSRRSCRCVCAAASAGLCDTPSHIHTHKQGSHAVPKCAPSWRLRRCSSRPQPPHAPRNATPRHRRRS